MKSANPTGEKAPPARPAPVLFEGRVPIAKISVVDQARKKFDEKALQELSDNIRACDIINPLTLRPDPKMVGEGYQLVSGERRLRAAKLAGLATVPARVLDLTDAQALEFQAAENIHRRDLTPIEEARMFRALLDGGKYDVAALAGVVDKSEVYVYRAIRLLELPESVIEKIESGELTPAHGHQLLRVPEHLRSEVFEDWSCDWRYKDGQTAVKHLVDHIDRTLGSNLDGAPFPKKDEYAGVHGCTACPDNSANHGMLFEGAEKGKCLRQSCFNQKLEHFHNAKLLALGAQYPDVSIHVIDSGVYEGHGCDMGKSRVTVELKKGHKLASDESLVFAKGDGKVWVAKKNPKPAKDQSKKPKSPREKAISTAMQEGIADAAHKLKAEARDHELIQFFKNVDSWELTNLCKEFDIPRKNLVTKDCLRLGALVVAWHNCDDQQFLKAMGIDVKKLQDDITKKAGADFDLKNPPKITKAEKQKTLLAQSKKGSK